VVDDVWLKFQLQYYRKRNTLRRTAVTRLSSLLRGQWGEKRKDEFWALRGVTLSVPQGEVLGLVGPNGAGKSTLLRVIAGIYAPDHGRVTVCGTVATLLSFGAGFDLRRPGRENIYKNATLLGLTRECIDDRADAIVAMSGLGKFIDAPVMTYSAGMRARLGFSIAVNVDPDVLLIDEVVGVGDERFRARVGNIFDRLASSGRTIVFATHSLALLEQYCTQAVWIEEGQVRLQGAPSEVAKEYLSAAKTEE
jgi:ABC-type polysaccharide/polyol phosphate transport system ATPase subunit